MPQRRIYLLSPRELSPETIAVAFAKTSRSPQSFREIAETLDDEKSAKFHEKWVVGYGHASVAEHAVLHIALENVSRLAIESIESNRLASYTEKSTRYQKWEPGDFHVPDELAGQPQLSRFKEVCGLLFSTYLDALDPVREVVLARAPRREEVESEQALDRRLRSQYVDVCRFLLPAASLANVGMTANARVLENVIRKMLSHPLAEVRAIGDQLKIVTATEVPTLVKYADSVPYLVESARDLEDAAANTLPRAGPRLWSDDDCTLVTYDPKGENYVLAGALHRHAATPFGESLNRVQSMSPVDRESLARLILGGLAEHDTPLRELEHASYTFDLVMDQGAYAEFKRHRMMTQTPQRLSTHLGYAVPRLIAEAGIASEYQSAMQAAADLYADLAPFDVAVAQYIVPNGFRRRVLATFNLREAFAFCELRSAPNAHFSIRRVAGLVAREIRRVHPLLASYMRLPDESPADVQARHFVDGRAS